MSFRTFLLCCVVGASLVGCAGAQVSQTVAGGGELAMWGPVMPAASAGREALLDHCGGAYGVDARGVELGLGRRAAAFEGEQGAAAANDQEVRVVRFRCNDALRLARR